MIKQSKMSNGIKIVTDSMPYVRSVTIGFWLNCGSRQDDSQTIGTAHFIEHMLFKGTEKRTAKQLALKVDVMGGQINAFTSAEYTCYYLKILDTHLEQAIELLSDMLLNSLFLPEAINREKNVILQEYDMYKDSPEDLIQDKFYSYIWKNHPLGRNIIGRRKTIKSINREKLITFKDNYYTPDNLVVAIAGNIQHEKVTELVDKYLGKFIGKAAVFDKIKPTFNKGYKFIKKDTEQIQILWGIESVDYTDKDWYAASLLNNILGSSASSRLFQKIREENGLAYFIYSVLNSYSDVGIFTINAAVKPENSKKVLSMLKEELQNIAQNGITEKELLKAKEQTNSSILMSLESSNSRMNRIGRLLVMNRPLIPIEKVIEKINQQNLVDVNNVAVRLFAKSNPALLKLGPQK